jgi:hypothetical protein
MAKIKLDPRLNIDERALTETGKRPSFFGRLTFSVAPSGVPVARAWPRPSSHVPSEREELTRLWLRYAAYLFKVTAAPLRELLQRQSKGLWLQPRDIFTAALAGRLFYFELPDGRKIFSAAVRDDMSESFDVFGTQTGLLIVRKPEGWRALAPGVPGEVLVVTPDGLPGWAAPEALSTEQRRVWLDALQLQGTGQGAGNVALSSGRRGITFSGTATSSMSFSVPVTAAPQVLTVRIYTARTGTDGGNYDIELQSFEFSSSSAMLAQQTQRVTVAAPLSGTETVYSFTVSIPFRSNRVAVTFSFSRYGATAADSNQSNSFVWAVEVIKQNA